MDLSYTVSLEDDVSKRAGLAAASVRKLETELRGLREEQLKYQRAGFKGAANNMGLDLAMKRHELDAARAGLRDLRDQLRDVGESKHSVADVAGSFYLLKEGAEVAADAVEGVARATEFVLNVAQKNQRLEATFDALNGTGGETLAMLNELSSLLPQSRDELAGWTKEVESLGITDLSKVRTQVTALASAQAIMGESGAQAYEKLLEKIRLAEEGNGRLKLSEKKLETLFRAGIDPSLVATKLGMTVYQLQQRLEAGTVSAVAFGDAIEGALYEKGQKPLKIMMSSIEALEHKGLEVFSHLFDDINTTPLTDALQSVIELGDQGDPSGKALHEGITTGVNGIIKDLAHMVIKGEVAFLKFQIFAEETGLSIHSVWQDVKDLGEAAEIAAKPFVLMAKAIGWVADQWEWGVAKGIFAVQDRLADNDAKEHRLYDDKKPGAGIPSIGLPGHASGGIVTRVGGGMATVRPFPGEGLASIGVGEQIIPRRERSRQIEPYTRAGIAAAVAPMAAANSNGARAGGNIRVDQVNVTAPSGITNATNVTVTGLAIALEHLQNMGGR